MSVDPEVHNQSFPGVLHEPLELCHSAYEYIISRSCIDVVAAAS